MVQHQNINLQQAGQQFKGEMESGQYSGGKAGGFGGRSINNH